MCQQLVELITDYLEGALPRAQHRAVRKHLAGCKGCTAYIEQLRTTIALTGKLVEDDIDPAMMDSLLQAFRNWDGRSDDGRPSD